MPDSVRNKMFINGIWQDASDGKRFDSINKKNEDWHMIFEKVKFSNDARRIVPMIL